MLQVYNSLTRRKEPFEPLNPGHVGIYVCGPTVYGHSHIGHAKSYVAFDVVVRYLRHLGLRVRYVQNITDVGHLTDDADAGEDKIAKQAALERLEPMEVVESYTRSYFEDMDALNVLRPDISPRASGHIPEQIALTERLIDLGYAYERNGSVYFDVRKFAEYGKLSGRKLDELQEAVRIEGIAEKQSAADFALWKKAGPEHIMQWDSPWGKGFPGWHLECSVMSSKYLGQPFDIHGGGLENIFPHHECEVAQSEAGCGAEFAKVWMHNNMVTVDGVKMGKSLGNAISLKSAFDGSNAALSKAYSGLVVRFSILQSHYRSITDFSDDALLAAEKGLDRLHSCVRQLRKQIGTAPAGGEHDPLLAKIAEFEADFTAAMDDDFNTPVAIGYLFELVREVNGRLAGDPLPLAALQAADSAFQRMAGDILGIVPDELPGDAVSDELADSLMGLIIELRKDARERKDWAAADAIRDGLKARGVVLEDRSGGTVWRCE
jgi:cysteinyl-tRNA synthetase